MKNPAGNFKHTASRRIRRYRLGIALLVSGLVSHAHALSVDEARHLLTRTGFGAAPREIAALLPLSRVQAVDQLLAGMTTKEVAPPPPFLQQPTTDYLQRLGAYVPADMRTGKPTTELDQLPGQISLVHVGMQEMMQLRVWWLDQMISTPSPFSERLALFWHGHFTSKYFNVLEPRLMYDQLQTIRTLGSGNFAELLGAMMRDPAMLIFLDNAVNRSRAPNENFARELLELFTLGIGNYSQRDIKELARILAGNSVDFGGTWHYLQRPDDMDTGVKTFLGQTGAWTIDDAQRIILENPHTAQFIAKKFFDDFVSPVPDEATIRQLAAVLRDHHYEMQPFLRALLLSDAFWSPATRGQLVKSPVELLVGFVRTFGAVSPELEQLASYTQMLGQELFDPPTVQGWKNGMNWLSAQQIMMRTHMLQNMWLQRQAGIEYLDAGANDLLVRFSAETVKAAPAPLRVKVNDQVVYQGQARWLNVTDGQGQFSPKPAWDIVRVPRERLPADIHSIEVIFDKPDAEAPGGDYSNMFLNWVQVDGRRLPVYLATVKFSPTQTCDETQVPKGMLYCAANARFDLAQIAEREGQQDVTVLDKTFGPVNSIIEYGTARMPLVMRPAASDKAGLLQPLASQWSVVSRRASLPVLQPAISAVPLLSAAAVPARGADAMLKRLVLDPAYNIK